MIDLVIVTEGNNKLGLGHLIRCVSLFQAFQTEGAKPFIIANTDESGLPILSNTNHIVLDWNKEQKKFFALIKKYPIVILDSRDAKIDLYNKISKIIKIPVFFDDTNRFKYHRGVIINRTIKLNYDNKRKKNKVVYLLGPKYLPLTKSFWYAPEKNIRDQIKNILITFGGSDIINLTPKIIKFLGREYPNLNKTVIIGKAFENLNAIKESRDEKTQLYFYPNGETIKQIMIDSDICISAGGQTLYELARIGVPTIALKVVDNQSDNIRGLKEKDFLLEINEPDNEKILFKELRNSLEKLADPKIRAEKRNIGRSLVDGYGSVRIANFILGIANKF